MPDTLRGLLSAKGMEDLYELFASEEIDALMLPDLTDEELKEIGLKLGQRKRFRAAFGTMGRAGRKVPMPAERRQLTVVFCDLVGSTALATVLDPEDLRDVITTYLDTAVAVAKSHGGYLAYTQGDGLMIYFGYPLAQEDDPMRALRASLAIVTAVQELDTLAPEPLNVRLGVATGRVVVGDTAYSSAAPQDFVVGETPNLASRMQTLASPGEVIVAGSTKALATGAFSFKPLGTAIVKGFEEPRTYFAVLGEITSASRFDTRSTEGVQPIVGRDAELKRLSDQWTDTVSGKAQSCLISGPPGIGKSRLVRALYANAGPAAIEWQCARHLSNRALHPMAAELERASGISRSDNEDTRRSKLSSLIADAPNLAEQDLPVLADLLGVKSQEIETMDAPTRSKLTFDVLARRIEGLAESAATLVVLEDAHWADATTLDFLGFLSDRVAQLPVFLVVTCRPELFENGAVSFEAKTINLEPIDTNAGLSLVNSLGSDRALSAALARLIIEKTDGIPLFVEELTKSILDAFPGNNAMSAEFMTEMDIPATLQDSLMARLDRLGSAKEIAQLGAVIGREFTAAMVRAIAPSEAEVEEQLLRLESTELVHRNGLSGPEYFVFNHALVQDTAYESILRSNRQEIHLKLAKAMLEKHDAFKSVEPEIIARHSELGELFEEAVENWMRAGQQGLDRAANPAAVNHFGAALRCMTKLPENSERDKTELQIQMSLAPASMATFGWAADEVKSPCLRASELAKKLEDYQALYGATWGLWTNYFLRGEMDEALASANFVREMAEQSGSPVLLTTSDHARGFSNYFRGDFETALAQAEAGIANFDIESERQIVAMFQFSSTTALHSFAAASHWMQGNDKAANSELQKALLLPEELAHAPSLAFCLAFTQYTLMYKKEWSRVHETATRLARLSDEEGFLMWGPQAEVFLGLCDCESGDITSGLERVRRNFELYAATGTGLTLMQMLPSFGEALIQASEFDEAQSRLSAMIADAERRSESAYLPELYRVLGEAHFAAGDRANGAANLRNAYDLSVKQGAVPLIRRADESLARFETHHLAEET